MKLTKAQQLQAIGIVFLICGIAFLAVGFFTKFLAFYTMGPALLGLSAVFLATSKSRGK